MIYVICGVLLLFFVIMIAVGNYDWYEVKNKKNGKKKSCLSFSMNMTKPFMFMV